MPKSDAPKCPSYRKGYGGIRSKKKPKTKYLYPGKLKVKSYDILGEM